MGTWYLSLAASLVLLSIGIFIHWSVVVLALILPFIPMLSFLLSRRTARRRQDADDGAGGTG